MMNAKEAMEFMQGEARTARAGDARWELLWEHLVHPTEGLEARKKILADAGQGVSPDGGTSGVTNYVCEPLPCANAVTYDPGVNVGPIPGVIRPSVHPLGGGNSSSECAFGRPDGTLLRMVDPTRPVLLPLDDGTLCAGVDVSHRVRVRGGALLRELNAALDHLPKPQALENLPAYMGLTVAGAISTGVHGSGASMGPFCDMVESITLRLANGKLLRVEPTSVQLTDGARWKAVHPEDEAFVQDDEVFYSVVVAVGAMGVIEDVVLRVMDAYALSEVHEASTWGAAKAFLRAGKYVASRHCEILVSPYSANGVRDDAPCAILTRRIATMPPENPLPVGRRPSALLNPVFALGGKVITTILNAFPFLCPIVARKLTEVYGGMLPGRHEENGQPATWGGPSYEVLDLGPTDEIRGVATEIAFVLPGGDPDAIIGAMDAVLDRAAQRLQSHEWVNTLPTSLRFMRASRHHLAMQYGDPAKDYVCTAEMLSLYDVVHNERPLVAFQTDALTRRGRPHWGQRNAVMASAAATLYPKLSAWKTVRGKYDPTDRFGNPLTDAWGLGPSGMAVPVHEPTVSPFTGGGTLDDRCVLDVDTREIRTVVTRFYFADVGAGDVAQAFLKTKSTQTDFGPMQLVRDPKNIGKDFAVGERFEGRMRLDRPLRTELDTSPLPSAIKSALDGIMGSSLAVRIASRLSDTLTSNYCLVTHLDLSVVPGRSPFGRYVFLSGSPVSGGITFEAADVAGHGCVLTYTFAYTPNDAVTAVMMDHFGQRLTQVVGYIEVEAAAKALGKAFVSDMQPPTTVERCAPAPLAPAGRLLPVDPESLIAIKQDVRVFDVDCGPDEFVAAFHQALSLRGDFGFFKIERPNPGGLFAVGDTFVGVFTMTDELKQSIQKLHPPGHWGGDLAAESLRAVIDRYLADDPPRDYGQLTELNNKGPTYSVRYDYLEGTPIAGHSRFEVVGLSPGHCRVTQTFVYQEQSALTVEAFGTVGLYIHNLVVTREISATAEGKGWAWRAVER